MKGDCSANTLLLGATLGSLPCGTPVSTHLLAAALHLPPLIQTAAGGVWMRCLAQPSDYAALWLPPGISNPLCSFRNLLALQLCGSLPIPTVAQARSARMEVTQEHISAGCNRVVGALDWGDSLVAYAAHNLVVVYDAEVSDPYHCDSCSRVQHRMGVCELCCEHATRNLHVHFIFCPFVHKRRHLLKHCRDQLCAMFT